MPHGSPERRTFFLQRLVLDQALSMAAKRGWRYALAYLIRENIGPEVIRRLLRGQGVRTRHSLPPQQLPLSFPPKNQTDTELVTLLHSPDLHNVTPATQQGYI